MPLNELILSILNLTIIGLSLAVLGYLIRQGALREKHLRLGPTRDLRQPRVVYVLTTFLVLGYAILLLRTDSGAPLQAQLATQFLPFLLIGMLMIKAGQTQAGFRKIGLAPRHPGRDARLGLVSGVVGFGLAGAVGWLVVLLFYLLDEPVPQVAHDTLIMLREEFSIGLLVTVFIFAVVFAPLMEEIIFRGMLQTALMRLMNGTRWPAILLTAVVFAVIHAPVVPIHGLASLLVVGLVWGYVYERTGSLLTPILSHAVFNAMNIAITLALPGNV